MGTRSQAFTAKIKNLQELQLRLVSGSVPQPQGHEVSNSLKYFRLVKFTESNTLFLSKLGFFLQNIKNIFISVPHCWGCSGMCLGSQWSWWDVVKETLNGCHCFQVWITRDYIQHYFSFLIWFTCCRYVLRYICNLDYDFS